MRSRTGSSASSAVFGVRFEVIAVVRAVCIPGRAHTPATGADLPVRTGNPTSSAIVDVKGDKYAKTVAWSRIHAAGWYTLNKIRTEMLRRAIHMT